MTENTENTEPAPPPDYGQLLVAQNAKVAQLEEQNAKKPSDELARELDAAADRLRHYAACSKRDPKGRAERAAKTAANSVLARAMAAPGR